MDTIKLHQFKEKLELLGYSNRAIKDYPAYVRLFFEYLEKEEQISSVEKILPEHITGYHAYLQYNKLNRNNWLSSVTIRLRLQTVKTFYQVMYREKLIDHDYAPLIKLPKRKKSLPKHVPSEKDMKRLLDSIEPGTDPIKLRDRTLLELLYATGIRNEESRTISIDNLDLYEKTVLVCGKGSKERVVPIGEWVLPWLREYLVGARKQLVNKHNTTLLFISKNGRKLTEGNLCDLMRKYVKRSGLDYRITPHSLRHACATHLLKNGADIRYVQELLGHSDLSSTQIYTKLDIGFLKKAHKIYHPRDKEDE